MKTCALEHDVLEAVLAERLTGELHAHAEICAVCREVVSVASLIHEDFSREVRQAHPPTAAVVWWRAQMRAREDAARAAARPIVFVQALAVAAAIGMLVALAGRLTLSLPTLAWPELTLVPLDLPLVPLALAAGCWLVLAPVALYLAFSRD